MNPRTQADAVRRSFADAPETARAAFQIGVGADGETVFTWPRVLLRAVK